MLYKILISLIFAICPANIRSEIGYVSNSVTIVSGGNYWNYDTEFSAGQRVIVTFDTKGTEVVVDDEIIKVEEVYYDH